MSIFDCVEGQRTLDRAKRNEGQRTLDRARCVVLFAALLAGCATVKPQDRAVLADPVMRIGDESAAGAQVGHAVENREAASGGEGVSGGGCGCN